VARSKRCTPRSGDRSYPQPAAAFHTNQQSGVSAEAEGAEPFRKQLTGKRIAAVAFLPVCSASCPIRCPEPCSLTRWRQTGTRKHRRSGLSEKADEGTRTPDPLLTMEVLYQLSYVGVFPGSQAGSGGSRIRTCVGVATAFTAPLL
jgi:hypothetical protein